LKGPTLTPGNSIKHGNGNYLVVNEAGHRRGSPRRQRARARPLPGGRFAVEWRPSTGAPTSGKLPILKRRPASNDRLSAASVNGVIPRMARRPAPPPKPKSPTLTVGQTRRRVERLQKCVTKLEAFDPQKAHKRAPAVLELEATIDKALSSAFGYGTPAYLRYNEAATLDPSPLLAAARANTARPVGASPRQDVKVQETREHFSENRSRAIALLQQAIRTLDEEIAEAGSKVEKSNPSKPLAESTAEAPLKPRRPQRPNFVRLRRDAGRGLPWRACAIAWDGG
jgi:hypothetical protein